MFLEIVVFRFVLFLLAIVLYVLLRYTDSDYPFGIFKLFLRKILDIVIQLRRVCLVNKYIFLSVETIDQSIFDDNINGSFNTKGKTTISKNIHIELKIE
jgi:hypothetical protein